MTLINKLAKIRVDLQEKQLKKSGENNYQNYKYFQLSDFIHEINRLNLENEIIDVFSFDKEKASLTLMSGDERLEFSMPISEIYLSEKNMSLQIQGLGSIDTYLRRYLYMNAYNIAATDELDGQNQKNFENDDLKKAKDELKKLVEGRFDSKESQLEFYKENKITKKSNLLQIKKAIEVFKNEI